VAHVLYVYGIVASDFAVPNAPAGLDDAPVIVIREERLAALASELDADVYGPDSIETRSEDLDWVARQAVAHDAVLTWASDRGAVVPLALFSAMYSAPARVKEMLRSRAASLLTVLSKVAAGREYALRVYRIDSELKAALPSLNEEIAALSDAAKAASPGQRYLLERKLDERAKEEIRSTSARIAGEIRQQLADISVDSTVSSIPKVTRDAPGTMVLNAAFLIAPDRLHTFQERLTEIVNLRQPAGFRFDFTGPWPPYHFARASDE
jgi:hypothetical protein